MRIVLEIDDSCIPHIAGREAAQMIFDEIAKDPRWWFSAADAVRIAGHFGAFEDVR